MMLARVTAAIVSTEKHPHYRGYKILAVRPESPDGKKLGSPTLAVDTIQAGIGDLVLLIDEGGSARLILGDGEAVTIRTAVAGIVDRVDRDAGLL